MTDEATPDTGKPSAFFPDPNFATVVDDTSSAPEPETEIDAAVQTTDAAAQVAALADELGITVGQLKGRLEASRKWEERAKKADARLDDARLAAMSEQERAIETARSEARAATLLELGQVRVGDAFRVAAAGRDIDIDSVLEAVDLSKFLDDDGHPDTVKVGDWVERIAPLPETSATPKVPELGQGARPTPPGLNSSQLERDLMAKLGVR